MDKEYAGITGVADFTKASAKLALGENSALISEGAVRFFFKFFFSFYCFVKICDTSRENDTNLT